MVEPADFMLLSLEPSVFSAMLFRRLSLLLLSLTTPALLSGCETTDKMLGAAERAVGSSTGRTVLDFVGGKDPGEIARAASRELWA